MKAQRRLGKILALYGKGIHMNVYSHSLYDIVKHLTGVKKPNQILKSCGIHGLSEQALKSCLPCDMTWPGLTLMLLCGLWDQKRKQCGCPGYPSSSGLGFIKRQAGCLIQGLAPCSTNAPTV